MISPHSHHFPVEGEQWRIYPTREETLKFSTWLTEDICDFGLNFSNSGEPGSNSHYSTQQPLNVCLVATHSPLIPSPHYLQRLKKTYFMFYKAWEPTGNECVPAWKTNKENEGEKSAVERRIYSSFARATEWETFFCLLLCTCVCIIAAGWNSAASIWRNVFFCFFFSVQACLLINVVILLRPKD